MSKFMHIQHLRKIVADGRHNAFTGMAFFKGRYFVVFRSGAHHADAEGFQVIQSSGDGLHWETVHKKTFFRGGDSKSPADYRDSYFLNLGDELRLHSFSTPFDADGERQPRESQSSVQITRDGISWTEPRAIAHGRVLWKPIFWEGQFWCAGYRRLPHPGPVVTELYRSPDGLAWNSVARITEGNETALLPVHNRLRAFVRTNNAPRHLEIWESNETFTAWAKIGAIPKIIQAPHLEMLDGAWHLFGREVPPHEPGLPKPHSSLRRTKVWRLDGTSAIEVLELPSGGDTSYVGTAACTDGSFLMSYYSQHEIADPRPSEDDPNSKPADLFVASVALAEASRAEQDKPA